MISEDMIQDGVCAGDSEGPEKELGVQINGYLKLTEAEEKTIFDWDLDAAAAVIREIVMSGRFIPVGECCISSKSIRKFNDHYHTNYREDKIAPEM